MYFSGLSSARKWPGCFSSPVEEKANTTWNPSVPSLYKQDDAAKAPDSHFPFGERLHSTSRIQQIIDKYTRDLSWCLSSGSSHGNGFRAQKTMQLGVASMFLQFSHLVHFILCTFAVYNLASGWRKWRLLLHPLRLY